MSEEKPGYIPLFRKFFDHYLWEESREFSKAEAWIDCIQMARYKKTKRKKFMGGNLIEWGYGQFPASIRFLKERWGWGSNTKVNNFLSLLVEDDMIKIEKRQGQNVITLCNYSNYDIKEDDKKDNKKTLEGQREDRGRTEEGQNSKKGNKEKKGNKNGGVWKINNCPVPDVLASLEFVHHYKNYCDYLEESKNITSTAITTENDFGQLVRLKNQGNDPIAVIQQTIGAKNKSFYELKDKQFNNQENEPKPQYLNKL